jgi:ferredoxin
MVQESGATPEGSVPVTVVDGDEETTIAVEPGRNLRGVLLEHGFDVYGSVSRVANCGGRGLCGTCGVRLEGGPDPEHWHDRAAERWGYPRLSCQVTVESALRVELVEKVVWGQLRPRR